MDQDSVRTAPSKISDNVQASKYVFAGVSSSNSFDVVHEVDDGRGVFCEVQSLYSLFVIVISVTDKGHSNLKYRMKVRLG